MGNFWKKFFLLMFCVCSLCGCGANHTKPDFEVVTSIDILTEHEGQLLRRHYTAQEKMRPVLLYLRMLKHSALSEPIDEPVGEDIFLITVGLSSGRRRYYRQAKHRYFSFENGPWRSIEPGSAAGLYAILRKLPDDTEKTQPMQSASAAFWG